MLGQGGMSQALYWSIYDQSEAETSIDQLIATDSLEKLLEVKTLTFELRSQSEILIEYFSKPATLKKLLRIIFNVKESNEITERAIEVLSCAENLKHIIPNLVASHELLQLPFEALTRNISKLTTGPTDPLLPGDLCKQFVYNGFNKLIHAILFSPKRVMPLVEFLKANIGYMRAWVAHTVNSCVTNSLKEFLIDTVDTCPEACKSIAELAMSSGTIYALVSFLTSSDKSVIPFECVTSASSILSQIIYRRVPCLYEVIIDRIPIIAEYVLSSHLHGPSLFRLPQASDVMISALSSIITTMALKYHELSQVILSTKIPAEIHKKRMEEALGYIEEMHVPKQASCSKAKADSKKSSSSGSINVPSSLITEPKLTPLGVKEIDELEAIFAPTFFRVIQLLGLLPERLNYMMSVAPTNALGIGCFDMIKMIGRLLAITADIRDQLYFKRTGINPVQEWIAGETNANTTNNLFDFSRYACLSNFAHAGAGGTSETPFVDTIQIGSDGSVVPFVITTSNIILKLIKLQIPAFMISLFKRFPEHSNLHFVISRVLLPLVEFVDYNSKISMHIFKETTLLKDMHDVSSDYTVFKRRNSKLTYYVTFAKAFLRMSIKLSDEAAMEEKRKYVSNSTSTTLTTISCPQTVPGLANLLAEGYADLDLEMCNFLTTNDDFKEFSKLHLEPEESIPKTFGDARLSSDYAEATRQANSTTNGAYDTTFSWTSGTENNADFLFSNFGNFATNDKENTGFSLSGLSAAVTDVEGGDIYAQFGNMWSN